MIISLRLLSKSVYYCTYSLKVFLIGDAKGSLLHRAGPKFEVAAGKRAYHLATPPSSTPELVNGNLYEGLASLRFLRVSYIQCRTVIIRYHIKVTNVQIYNGAYLCF
jgi:hypothetical protein